MKKRKINHYTEDNLKEMKCEITSITWRNKSKENKQLPQITNHQRVKRDEGWAHL